MREPMNELGLTDFESLQSDELVIDGLDVEGALASTKARGETLLRRRKIIRLTSILSAVAIAVLSIGTVIAVANSDTSEAGSIRTATRSETTVPTTVVPSTTVVASTAPPTVLRPQIAPAYVSIRQFGNEAVCSPPASVFEPNADGIVIGTSNVAESWNPQVGGTYSVSKPAGGEVTIIAKASNSAPAGQYADLASGFSTSAGYANISTLDFTYCESGLALAIERSGAGYILNITTW
jgi:hypothetical protein